MRHAFRISAAALAMLCAEGAAVRADPLKAGDVFNYEYTLTFTLPFKANPNLSVEQNAEAALHPHVGTNTFTFAVSVDRLNADGTAHAKVSPHYTVHVPGWTFVDFETTVLADGEIVPIVDLTQLKGSGLETGNSVNPGYRPSTPEQQLAMSAWSFNRRLLLFNDVALGVGKRKTFKDGDVWRIVIPDENNETIMFSYLRSESYRGHDTVVIGVDTVRTTASGPAPVKGTAYYDVRRNLLVGLEYEGKDDIVPSLGTMQTKVDVNLQ
jgi:hypothetical protein